MAQDGTARSQPGSTRQFVWNRRYSHPHAAESGDGDARDDADLDAFECANVNAATRSGYRIRQRLYGQRQQWHVRVAGSGTAPNVSVRPTSPTGPVVNVSLRRRGETVEGASYRLRYHDPAM